MLHRLFTALAFVAAAAVPVPALAQTPGLDPRIQKLLSEISEERLRTLTRTKVRPSQN